MEFSWIARYAMLYDSSVKAPPPARYGLCWVSPGAGYPFLWGVMSVRWPWHGQPTLCHEPAENIKWKFLKTNPWNTKANSGCKPRPRIIINHPALMILMIFWWSKEALEQSCDDQISVALLILWSVRTVTEPRYHRDVHQDHEDGGEDGDHGDDGDGGGRWKQMTPTKMSIIVLTVNVREWRRKEKPKISRICAEQSVFCWGDNTSFSSSFLAISGQTVEVRGVDSKDGRF